MPRLKSAFEFLRWNLVLGISILLLCIPGKATHIVGAELWYDCVDSITHSYRITLRLLRDCQNGQADFDNPISLSVIPTNNVPGTWFEPIPMPFFTPEIIPEAWNLCVGRPYNICVEEGIYSTIVTLPPIRGGYNIGWARCCRNSLITNLANPLTQGVTFTAHVPGPDEALCNSMPRWNNSLPVFICRNQTFSFDHSATDPDGDSLVYALTRPFDRLNFQNLGTGNQQTGGAPPFTDPTNPLGPPPYQFVNYLGPGFNATNPFGPGTATIDAFSGWLTFIPNNLGIYVVAISVFEYRNGVLISENKKDFQIHVIDCLPPNPPPLISHNLTGLDTVLDTIYVVVTEPFCYTVTVRDSNVNDLLQAFPVSAVFGSNNPTPPNATISFSGTNPLLATICWKPGCGYAGDLLQLIIAARDSNDCPDYNYVYDTVFIRVLPPPPIAPGVGYDLSTVLTIGDTIIAKPDSNLCFTWWVVDTLRAGGNLSWTFLVEEVGGNGDFVPIMVPDTSFTDSIPIQLCWTSGCENMNRVYRLILTAREKINCPPVEEVNDTLYFKIPPPPNPPPVVSHDLNGNLFVDDTIYVDVHDTLCYTFLIQDTFPAYGLDWDFDLFSLDLYPAAGLDPEVTILIQNDSILGRICWTPSCINVDRIFMLVTTGIQQNRCEDADSRDTVYVRVRDVTNPPPLISHTFLPGYMLQGDTISIAADSVACFEFTLRDTFIVNSYLSISVQTLLSDGSPGFHDVQITFTDSTDTLLKGTICFSPGCQFANQDLLVVLTGRDTFDCNPVLWVYDTIYIRVIEPFNNPPTIRHDLSGLPLQGSAVISVPRGEPWCYEVILEDPDPDWADLTAAGANEIFDVFFRYGNPAQISLSGDNPLIITVCWNPSCYDSGKEFTLLVCGRDTSRCGLTPQVCDSVKFLVEDCNIQVQNVMTPNGDGVNDDFVPFDRKGVENYTMEIFDRWGRQVFETQNGAWNGTYKGDGRSVPEGVYYYIVKYLFYSARGVPLKDVEMGYVTLLR